MINQTPLMPLHRAEPAPVHTSVEKMKIIQSRGFKSPKLPFLSATLEGGEPQTIKETIPHPVVTIDDLEALAQQLLAGIEILKSYKYPLAVRRGVKRP